MLFSLQVLSECFILEFSVGLFYSQVQSGPFLLLGAEWARVSHFTGGKTESH